MVDTESACSIHSVRLWDAIRVRIICSLAGAFPSTMPIPVTINLGLCPVFCFLETFTRHTHICIPKDSEKIYRIEKEPTLVMLVFELSGIGRKGYAPILCRL